MFAAILMVIDGGSIGALSYFVKPMIDDVFVAANHDMIWPIAGIMFSIFFARAISSYGQRCLTNYVGLRFITDIQQNLSRHLLTLDNAFFHSHPPAS